MSVKCPSCGFDSPDGAAWCDFCKEPFAKKPKAAASPAAVPPPAPPPQQPPALAGLTKESVEKLAVADLLKPEVEPATAAPSWLRPFAWAALALCIVLGTAALFLLQRRYESLRRDAPPGAAPATR